MCEQEENLHFIVLLKMFWRFGLKDSVEFLKRKAFWPTGTDRPIISFKQLKLIVGQLVYKKTGFNLRKI